MARQSAERMQRAFFRKCGANMETIVSLFESLPDVAFYVKDKSGRIMAINRRNCELCNIPSPQHAIGKRSSDMFPKAYADFCMARDRQVVATGVPIVNQRYSKVANLSKSLNILSIYPIRDNKDTIIGTLCVYRRGIPEQVGPIWEEKIDRIVEQVNARYHEDLTVKRLAEENGMSVTHLRRLFVRTIGVSPGHYITTTRINAASRLLEQTSLCISDIASDTGFCDQSHFTKMFKSLRGMTPGAYRRRHAQI